jgi:triacylglycerol esterase/lipase EstA (alpha/beta hydrolase family)
MALLKSILYIILFFSLFSPLRLFGKQNLPVDVVGNDSIETETTIEKGNSGNIHSATGNTDIYTPLEQIAAKDDWMQIEDVNPELSLEGRIPLLMVHGWNFGDQIPTPPGAGYLDYFKNFLLNDPELRKYFKLYYVKYWSNVVSVKQLGSLLRDKVELAGFHERPFVLIGHSMGGLVSRSFMNEYSFTTGFNAGIKCGDIVKLLITLGSPHHGSPMANGPARNDKIGNLLLKLLLPTLDRIVFSETKYNEVNRSDLRWDNYDNLFNYTKFPGDKNDWLSNLNTQTVYDTKLICYSASVTGVLRTNPSGVDEQYQTGSYLMKESFGFNNDGIVPVQSSTFAGHTLKKIRSFSEYNHADIVKGKSGGAELFNPMKEDLLELIPPRIIWPNLAGIFVKHSQSQTILWDATSSVQNVNIYFSGDNGQSYNMLANNIEASTGLFQWSVPDTNLTQCLIKITNASNESLYTVSANTFTIYHNWVKIDTPVAKTYFVPNQTNTIRWQQFGIAPAVRLTYHDHKNNFEKVIAEELSVGQQSNAFDWTIDNSIPPSDSAFITIEILGMNELCGDDENYSFTSARFMMLGEPGVTITAPSALSLDEFGVSGEKLEITSNYLITWQTEGEIKSVKISLCDSSKNIIREIGKKIQIPGIHSNGYYNWRIPEIYGNQFYILIEAGPNKDTSTTKAYTIFPFRINRNVSIFKPLAEEREVSLLPCLELGPVTNATGYSFELSDSATLGSTYFQKSLTETPEFCLPNSIEYELIPGVTYQLIARAIFDTVDSYPTRTYFQTVQEKPSAFQTMLPIENDTIEGITHLFNWNRAIGAGEYQIDISYQKNSLFSGLLSRTDTSISIDLGRSGRPDTLFWEVTARNDFGETAAKSFFFKKNRTGINHFELERKDNFNLTNYPNPIETETTLEFNLPGKNKSYQVELLIYNLSGQAIKTVSNAKMVGGIQKIIWDGRNEFGIRVKKGIYIACLIVEQQSVTRSMIVK